MLEANQVYMKDVGVKPNEVWRVKLRLVSKLGCPYCGNKRPDNIRLYRDPDKKWQVLDCLKCKRILRIFEGCDALDWLAKNEVKQSWFALYALTGKP